MQHRRPDGRRIRRAATAKDARLTLQVLPDTLGLGPEVWRVLSKCHDMRNRTEYEGALDVDERLLTDLIAACRKVADKIGQLPAILQKSR
jgi:hypothetical protein